MAGCLKLTCFQRLYYSKVASSDMTKPQVMNDLFAGVMCVLGCCLVVGVIWMLLLLDKRFYCVTKAGLQLRVLLPQHPMFWNYWHVPPQPRLKAFHLVEPVCAKPLHCNDSKGT